MNLFDRMVDQAMLSDGALETARAAVEKELLHHDILRELSRAGLLSGLTFIGGTCLRACYGAVRLSEDLDFTGGSDFNPAQLMLMPGILEQTLKEKYGLPVSVSPPVKEAGNVSTWKLRMQTRPESKNLPAQRIHMDICALNSHQVRPTLLQNFYQVDMGTDGLIVRAQSREEILADKWLALVMRPNRVQYRDVWDILWLNQKRVQLDVDLLRMKTEDRRIDFSVFLSALSDRVGELETQKKHESDFQKEMARFLPAVSVRDIIGQPDFWTALLLLLKENAAALRDNS